MDWLLFGFIVQTIGSFLLLGGYLPQIVKLHKTKNPTGISSPFWVMVAVGCTAILINMIVKDVDTYIIITQALNALFAWYTLALVSYCRKLEGKQFSTKIKLNYISMTAILIMLVLIPVGVIYNSNDIGGLLQLLGTVFLLLAYVPQIIYLYKVKNADGISRWLYLILGAGLVCLTINYIITGASIGIIITEIINVALIFIQYGMTVYYQNKNN